MQTDFDPAESAAAVDQSAAAAADTPQIFSVSELNRAIRAFLEGEIGSIWVEGEISNFRRQSSGHQYFTLKDDRSQLACVMFRGKGGSALPPGVSLADGQHVQIFGQLTVYEARGQHQLIVQIVQPQGLGALQARFEALKRRLHAEGLFDPARKRPLPRFPLSVGLVTSPTGAALRDMLNILARRAPWLRVVIHPVRVQGQGAAAEIAQAIQDFSDWSQADDGPPERRVDLIVAARGGGSMEDLFEFNEETVARAIAGSALPVVSAVGHEIDFTIADFAADLRAPTPSAAAELIAPDAAELRRQLAGAAQFLERQLAAWVERARERLLNLERSALSREPLRRLQDARQRLDAAEETLSRAASAAVRELRARLDEKSCCLRLSGPQRAVELLTQRLQTLREKLRSGYDCQEDRLRARLREAESLLRVLGPQATLNRGYSITADERGEIIRSATQVRAGQRLVTRLSDGEARSTVDGE